MHPPHSAHALCVGPFVSRALRQSPLSVMAVFARTVYAQNSAGEILCLAGADLPLGPFTVVCNPWQAISDASLEVGDLLQMHNQTITGPRGLCIRMNQAARWSPPLPALGSMGQRTAGVERALALAPALAPQEGLAPLLLQLDAGQRPKSEDPFTEALRAAGREGLESLWRWLQTSRKDDLEDAAKRLLGLGPGLTPSGDDVLGGVFLALYALSLPDAIHALKEVLDERGEKATNHISLAYLKAAFRPLQDSAKYSGRLAKAAAAGERVLAVLDERAGVVDRPGAMVAHPFVGEIRFESVSFQHDTMSAGVLGRGIDAVDFVARPGQVVALVGA